MKKVNIKTDSTIDVIDITSDVQDEVNKQNVSSGAAIIFVPGSTASITTIEYEEGAVKDLKRAISEIVPKDREYQHNNKWHDGNGHSHIRAALMGPSITVPIEGG